MWAVIQDIFCYFCYLFYFHLNPLWVLQPTAALELSGLHASSPRTSLAGPLPQFFITQDKWARPRQEPTKKTKETGHGINSQLPGPEQQLSLHSAFQLAYIHNEFKKWVLL